MSTPSAPARQRRGVTLIEIVVVITIIASMAIMGAGIFTGVTDHFRARRSMEILLWDLRKVQQAARSRGHAENASTPANFGVMFYNQQVHDTGAGLTAVAGRGFSYLPYAGRLATPPTDLGTLPAGERGAVVNLDAAIGTPAPLPPLGRIQFTVNVAAGSADLVPDGPSNINPVSHTIDFPMANGEGRFQITIEHNRFIGLRYIP